VGALDFDGEILVFRRLSWVLLNCQLQTVVGCSTFNVKWPAMYVRNGILHVYNSN
jgi:hypothetical protein